MQNLVTLEKSPQECHVLFEFPLSMEVMWVKNWNLVQSSIIQICCLSNTDVLDVLADLSDRSDRACHAYDVCKSLKDVLARSQLHQLSLGIVSKKLDRFSKNIYLTSSLAFWNSCKTNWYNWHQISSWWRHWWKHFHVDVCLRGRVSGMCCHVMTSPNGLEWNWECKRKRITKKKH